MTSGILVGPPTMTILFISDFDNFASMVTYGIPIIAVAWGLYYGESISILQIGSLLIILAGVYIVNKPQQA